MHAGDLSELRLDCFKACLDVRFGDLLLFCCHFLRGPHFGELGAQLLGLANLQLVEVADVFPGEAFGEGLASSLVDDALKLIADHFQVDCSKVLKGGEGLPTDLKVVHLSEQFASFLVDVVLPHLHVDMRGHLGDKLLENLVVSGNHLGAAMALPVFLGLLEQRLKVANQVLHWQELFRGIMEQLLRFFHQLNPLRVIVFLDVINDHLGPLHFMIMNIISVMAS